MDSNNEIIDCKSGAGEEDSSGGEVKTWVLNLRHYLRRLDLTGNNEYCTHMIGRLPAPGIDESTLTINDIQQILPTNNTTFHNDGGNSISPSECHGKILARLNSGSFRREVARAFLLATGDIELDDRVLSANLDGHSILTNAPLVTYCNGQYYAPESLQYGSNQDCGAYRDIAFTLVVTTGEAVVVE